MLNLGDSLTSPISSPQCLSSPSSAEEEPAKLKDVDNSLSNSPRHRSTITPLIPSEMLDIATCTTPPGIKPAIPHPQTLHKMLQTVPLSSHENGQLPPFPMSPHSKQTPESLLPVVTKNLQDEKLKIKRKPFSIIRLESNTSSTPTPLSMKPVTIPLFGSDDERPSRRRHTNAINRTKFLFRNATDSKNIFRRAKHSAHDINDTKKLLWQIIDIRGMQPIKKKAFNKNAELGKYDEKKDDKWEKPTSCWFRCQYQKALAVKHNCFGAYVYGSHVILFVNFQESSFVNSSALSGLSSVRFIHHLARQEFPNGAESASLFDWDNCYTHFEWFDSVCYFYFEKISDALDIAKCLTYLDAINHLNRRNDEKMNSPNEWESYKGTLIRLQHHESNDHVSISSPTQNDCYYTFLPLHEIIKTKTKHGGNELVHKIITEPRANRTWNYLIQSRGEYHNKRKGYLSLPKAIVTN
ncbi:hypothetical protein RFI_25190 [Reticulomyxa filosa]|uniref:Uncharacterized protein n=1 Tax=Reticulomyxa filosa TaxID=46433 RepID=X6MFI4_RETFI|nr:hypothetical protein RFI_25190 [Reticulomyxa filosa]|eukprot:ETO12187.1 hypothetical protein RFI_25190 [Reticulomyxa filosa]